MLKIVFMGTPDFAKESLQLLYENGYSILGVVTNPDKPKGRGMKMTFSPVKQYALEKKLTIYQPDNIKDNPDFINKMRELNPDVICVVAYGKILPKEILEIPKLGSINLHGSILPKYRGAAPIQWAILNGDTTTGVTTMYMNEEMDSGDIILKQEVNIDKDETTGELWNRLSTIGANLLIETLKMIIDGKAPRIKQSKEYTMAPILKKEIAKISWTNQNAESIKNLVRGLNPIMGAYSIYHGKKLKFWKVNSISIDEMIKKFPDNEEEIITSLPGTIIIADSKIGLYIKAKEGIIQGVEIQSENSRRMNWDEFLRGNALEVKGILE